MDIAALLALFQSAAEPLFPVIAVAILAGAVRGFAGFGASMIFMPVTSAVLDPATAVIILWIIDGLPTLPIVIPALRECDWRSIIPVMAGYLIGVPIGVYILTTTDTDILRWLMSATILVLVALLMSGLRYKSRPKDGYSVGVGAIAGTIGGATQLSGPPILAYWLGGPDKAALIRANIIAFFGIGTLITGANYFWGGVFTQTAVLQAILVAPFYAAAIMLGSRQFTGVSEVLFRRVAYTLIILAAIVGAPLLDGLLRG